MPLEAPVQSGDQLAPADIENHTLIVSPVEYIEHIQTSFTQPGEKSPAIRVNVVDFVDPNNPVVYRGVLWFNVSLYNNLRRQIGSQVAGRMVKGQATPGRSAPWLLQDITQEADWMTYLVNWLDHTEAGAQFAADSANDVRTYAQAAQVAAATNPPAPAAPAAAPASVPAPPSVGPAPAASAMPPRPPATPVAPGVGAPPVTQAAPAAAPASAPAGDLGAMLANLPPEEQQKMLALLAQQQNASS